MVRAALALMLAVPLGCGARSGLDVDDPPPVFRPEPDAPCTDPPYTVASGDVGYARYGASGRLWWADGHFGGEVGWAPREGGRSTIVATDQPATSALVAEDTDAWWTSPGLTELGGELVAFERGRMRVLADGLFQPGALVLDPEHFYFADGTNTGTLVDEGRGRVLRLARAGGAVEVLARDLWLPTSVAVVGADVWWVDTRRGELGRVARGGGVPEIVLAGLDEPRHLRVHRGDLYFAEQSRVTRVALSAGAPEPEPVADFEHELRSLVVDDAGLFGARWDGTFGAASFAYAPWTTGEPVVVEEDAGFLAADGSRVYWTTGVGDPGPVIRGACKDWFRSL